MACKIYNLNDIKEIKNNKLNKQEMQSLVEKNSIDLLGLRIIDSEYKIYEDNAEYIDSLALDENYVVTIVEYKIGYGTRVIGNGLMFIDYIKNNLSEFKMLFNEKLKDDSKNVNYNARLVIIGDDFNHYDYECIKRLPYDIELVSLDLYTNNQIVLNKKYVSRTINLHNLKVVLNDNQKYLLNYINDNVLTINDMITINSFSNIITYRNIHTFMYVIINDGLSIIIKDKMYEINNINDIDNIMKLIEDAYDER